MASETAAVSEPALAVLMKTSKGWSPAVLVDGDKGLAQGGLVGIGVTGQGAWAGLLQVVPDARLEILGVVVGRAFAGRNRLGLFLFGRGVRFQHDLLARAGDVHGNALAAQLPGQHIGGGYVLFAGAGREVDRLGQAVSTKACKAACMRTCSSAEMSAETTNTSRISAGMPGCPGRSRPA